MGWLCISQTILSADQRVVYGFVSDADTGETLPFVNIQINDNSNGTITNEQGYYVLSISNDTTGLVFSHIGYILSEVPVFLGEKNSLKLDIALFPVPLKGDTITVTAHQKSYHDPMSISTLRLSSQGLRSAPQFVGESNMLRTLQSLPGVSTNNEFQGGLYVRGGRPGQNLVLLDGAELYYTTHLYGIFSAFNMDAVKQVNLLKGGFPARYGGRVSSVLDITNKEGNRNRFVGNLHLGLVSSTVTLEGPIGKGAWLLAGRRTYWDYVLVKNPTYPGYYFYDLNGKITQQITARDKISLNIFKNVDAMGTETRVPLGIDPTFKDIKRKTQNWGSQLMSSKWSHQFSGRLWSDFIFYFSKYQNHQNRFTELDSDFIDIGNNGEKNVYHVRTINDDNESISLVDYTLQFAVHYHFNNNHTEHFGIAGKQLKIDYSGSVYSYYLGYGLTKPTEFVYQNKFHHLPIQGEFYWQDDWQVSSRLQFRNGFRLSSYSTSNSVMLLPRVALRYKFIDEITIKATWGRFIQYVSQLKMIEDNDNARVTTGEGPIFGNSKFFLPAHQSVQPTEAYHYILGMEFILKPGIQASLEGYYKQIYHIQDWKETTPIFKSIYGRVTNFTSKSLASMVESGTGQAYGLEFLIRKPTGVFSGWLSYTYSHTRLEYPSINDGKSFPSMYDRPHDFSVTTQYNRGKKWSFSLAWLYATGQPYTPLKQPKNSQRLKDYHRLDVGIFRTYRFKHKELKTYLQLFNAYNRKNVWGKVIRVNRDQEVPIEMDIRTLPIIPTFGFEVSF